MKINWIENVETIRVYLSLLKNENGRKLILALSL